MVLDLARAESGASTAPFDPVAAGHRRNEATAAIERACGSGPAGFAQRAVFRLVLANAQRYYALRENMRYHADFFLARMRELALARGAELAARGQLAAPADVFWLDLDELARAGAEDRTLAATVTERRAAGARNATVPPPETLSVPAGATAGPPAAARVLRGVVGAPGRCRGRARLVHGPADFARVAPGDVLVAVYTDPGWTPVLERAAGLVLEAGGLLSHGAIVARELGIPALVDVADATRAIADGDTVEIDGGAGTVTVVDRTTASG
jgi:pyruvate,water dikinase